MNTPDNTQPAHAEFGPSSLKYIAACSGWKSRGGTSDAAEKGTRIHEAVETRDPSGLRDEHEHSIYRQLVDAEERWLSTIFGDAFPIVDRELRLDVPLPFECDTFGTSDVVAVCGDTALVIDFKTGVGEIDDVIDNYQSKAYSVGVFHAQPGVETIHAVFLVPQRDQELHGVYTRDMLPQLELELATAIVKAKSVRPKWWLGQPELEELNPNNGCQYCEFTGRCPAMGHIAATIVARYEPDWVPDGPVRGSEVDDPDALGRLYSIACIMEKWAEGVKRKAVLRSLDGEVPTGFRVRSLGSAREITDAEELARVAQEFGVGPDELMQVAKFPFGAVSDLVGGRAAKGQKTASARAFEERLEASGALHRGAERFTLAALK